MIYKILIIVFIISNSLYSQNNYPIVLVHGFMGWGDDEMGGYNYWGGVQDYAEMLRNEGHIVINVSIGPVSSNWERAIEVYTQVKGGQIDYGKSHAEKFNIIQKPPGKIYKGLYPQWSDDFPIHIIGHSMGGQTARMLQYLLTTVVYEDTAKSFKENSELLGRVNKNWIKSITSIVTPHDGTTLVDVVNKTIPFIQYFIGIGGVVATGFYDFDLEHWGFHRRWNENWSEYLNRMKAHKAWGTKNISAWDLSLAGAKDLNRYLKADPDIYYFSFSAKTTEKSDHSSYHVPIPAASILTKTRSKILGSKSGYWTDGTVTDSTWYPNDGIVNTRSMYGPTTGIYGSDKILQYQEDVNMQLTPGQWYSFGPYILDHWQIIGHLGNIRTNNLSKEIFISHANRLRSLPSY